MEKILIAFHGSDCALGAVQHVADLAKRARTADPFLLYVGCPIPMRLLEGSRSAVDRLETQLREAGEKLLGPAKEALARAGIDAPVQVELWR
jgi:nucleotide-binding universal stress UspA family protein